MIRWPLPRPAHCPDDNDLFLVNVLIATIRDLALDSMGGIPEHDAGCVAEDTHRLMLKLIARAHARLVDKKYFLTEDGVEDLLAHLRKELP